MSYKIQKWDESYARKENFIFSAKEECIKFLNRFVKKKVGTNSYVDLIESENALDLGCGIGRQVILFEEFGINGFGVDISNNALNEAKKLGLSFGFDLSERLYLVNSPKLPFSDGFFQIATCDSVLDSMEFEFAKKYMKELDRTVSRYVYLNLISDDTTGSAGDGDELVTTPHEEGTIQSYYSEDKINVLIDDTGFDILQLHKITCADLLNNTQHTRFHIVLGKGV